MKFIPFMSLTSFFLLSRPPFFYLCQLILISLTVQSSNYISHKTSLINPISLPSVHQLLFPHSKCFGKNSMLHDVLCNVTSHPHYPECIMFLFFRIHQSPCPFFEQNPQNTQYSEKSPSRSPKKKP